MLAIVAAVVALTPAPEAHPGPVDAQGLFAPRYAASPFVALRDRPACDGAAKLQTGYEPALLFRDVDRKSARLRKLIELPMAEACLVESPR